MFLTQNTVPASLYDEVAEAEYQSMLADRAYEAHVAASVAPVRTFADLDERDLFLDNGAKARIVSPSIRPCDVPYVYLVRVLHKSEPLELQVEVSFNGEDSIACECNNQKVARKMIAAVLPDYYLPICDEWYLEDRSEECPF